VTNAQIADALAELGDRYELDDASVHRVLAYRTAARTVRDAPVSIAELAREGRVTELPGIGRTLEEKIRALLETGQIPALERLRARYPAGLIEIMRLPGFGPKRARKLYDELGVGSLDELRAAVAAGRVREVRGFGAKAEERLAELLAREAPAAPAPRWLLSRARAVGEPLVQALRAHPAADRVELAGSVRRLADSTKDLDVIATASDPLALARALTELPQVESAGTPTEAGVRAVTHQGLPVDLKVVAPDQFGNLLQHFTGSKLHNVALRERAVRAGLHISEYGVADDATGAVHRCATEEEVYALLGLPWIPPELREDRGELDAPALPELVRVEDLRGDLHCHTTLSDGRDTLAAMARAGQARGYEYLAVTDHSASHGFGNEVPADALRRRIEEVAELNARLDGLTVLAGSEVNIGVDGELDYPDELLARLDWVVASIHTSFRLGARAMTDRMVAAIEHPLVDAIGHPTGRKILARDPYPLDLERVIEAAARTGTMLEINSAPDRRDLDDHHARAAAEAGVRIVIDSDAHGADTLDHVAYGVATARRAWLTPEHVANTRPWPAFARLRKRAR
jgi:DNA polymerase (family 10)